MRFMTCDLLHKWGFEDGDQLDDLLRANGFDLGTLNCHDVLCAIVKDFVLPTLTNSIEVQEIGTHHNPIRIKSIDGVPVDNMKMMHPEIDLRPESVEVPDHVIVEYAHRVLQQRKLNHQDQ